MTFPVAGFMLVLLILFMVFYNDNDRGCGC